MNLIIELYLEIFYFRSKRKENQEEKYIQKKKRISYSIRKYFLSNRLPSNQPRKSTINPPAFYPPPPPQFSSQQDSKCQNVKYFFILKNLKKIFLE